MDPVADCGLEPADLHIGFRRDADFHAAEPILNNRAPDEQIAAYTMIGVLAGHGCPVRLPGSKETHVRRKETDMSIKATAKPARTLLSPKDHALILIDHQSQMAFNTKSIDVTNLRTNTAILAHAAKGFNVPTIITTISKDTFAGPLFDEITEAFPNAEVTDRTTSNAWEDENFIARVNAIGKDRLVMCGLWTSVCCNGPVLSALDQGYEVYVVTDACGDCTLEAHERAVERMIQAGARPMTALTYLLALQRDWARLETYDLTTGIAMKFGGAFGIGVKYVKTMFDAHESQSHK
jgi:nicotinamidase-related amidase